MPRMVGDAQVPTSRRLDGGEQQSEIELEQVDVRDGERDVSVDHDALVENAVEQIAQHEIGGGLFAHADSARAKWYAGHGPVKSKRKPVLPRRSTIEVSCCWNGRNPSGAMR